MKQINIHGGNMFKTSLILSHILHYLPLKYRTIKLLSGVIKEFFVSVSEDLHPVEPDVLSTLSDDYCDQYIIHAQDVESRLYNINITKAPGPDFLLS